MVENHNTRIHDAPIAPTSFRIRKKLPLRRRGRGPTPAGSKRRSGMVGAEWDGWGGGKRGRERVTDIGPGIGSIRSWQTLPSRVHAAVCEGYLVRVLGDRTVPPTTKSCTLRTSWSSNSVDVGFTAHSFPSSAIHNKFTSPELWFHCIWASLRTSGNLFASQFDT